MITGMKCRSCGVECPDAARYCWSCGQALRSSSDQRRVVTVLFADLVGFTSLSETLDPEQVKNLVDDAFERLVADVTAFGGRVDKIIGDAIVALFGAPIAHEDDAERAVRAGLQMQETLGQYSEETGAHIRMRIGVNTGEVLVGALRAGGDYTAMGDVVNIASRLETSAEPGDVLVGEATFHATKEVIGYESRGALVARGREEPVNVWVAIAALAPPGYRPRRLRAPLVGRDAELGMMSNAVDAAVGHRRAQQILILGEAGVGKTRLAEELAALAEVEHDMLVLDGRSVPYGEANVWWPIAEALRNGSGVTQDDSLTEATSKTTTAVARVLGHPESHPDVTRVVNGLLYLMGLEGPLRHIEPERARAEASQSLHVYIEAAAQQRPIMVRIADLHWADDIVLETIDYLTEELGRHPFLMVATARRSLIERWSPRAGRHNSLVVNLDPLDRDSAELLLDALLASDIPSDLRDVLLDRSGGNPFFLEELVVLLSEVGVGTVTDVSVSDLPDTLRGLVAARLDGLGQDERDTLEDASVWGSRGSLDVLDKMSEWIRDIPDVGDIVESLAEKEILTFDGTDWAFRSDLVREIAYSRLTKSDRMRRHSGIAAYLEAVFADRFVDDGVVDLIARHYAEAALIAREIGSSDGQRAELAERALKWIREAARRAEQAHVHPVSSRFFSQGLELLGPGAGPDHLSLLVGRAHANLEMWNLKEARADVEAALEMADGIGDKRSHARATMIGGGIATKEGDFEEAGSSLARAIEEFEAIGDQQGRAEALRYSGFQDLVRGELELARDSISAALDSYREAGDRRGEAWALQNLAWIEFTDGKVYDAEKRLSESAATFTDLGDGVGRGWALGLLAFVKFHQGHFDEGIELAQRVHHEAVERGDRWGQGMMEVVIASVELWSGRAADAASATDRAIERFQDLSETMGLQQALAIHGRALVAMGRIVDGMAALERAAALEMGESEARYKELSSISLANAAVQLGDPHPALLIEQDPRADEVDLSAIGRTDELVAVGLGRLQSGDVPGAIEVLELACCADNDLGPSPYILSALALALGAAGRDDEALARVEEVAESPRATYLDRLTAEIAAGLVTSRGEGVEKCESIFVTAQERADSTDDVVAQALVRLAEGVALTEQADHRAAMVCDDAEQRLKSLGIEATGWRTAYSMVASGRAIPA
ncbi:MAG: hypothetical protein EDR02_04890 [Actinobacteria bacterium]|nr:MAG: hypothetical protein EDR02_04890 [Actinomycetota bacterium]RIK05143.1 MAG: hypothetical protein DCC48_11020 [Acidobacteriota bacterium]